MLCSTGFLEWIVEESLQGDMLEVGRVAAESFEDLSIEVFAGPHATDGGDAPSGLVAGLGRADRLAMPVLGSAHQGFQDSTANRLGHARVSVERFELAFGPAELEVG